MREDKNENRWDKLLQIHTMGRDDSRSDLYRYPYEPTPYCVLERMANTGMIRKGNTLLDYGCGTDPTGCHPAPLYGSAAACPSGSRFYLLSSPVSRY